MFIIIADDLGWHPKINDGILSLLEKDCISGASIVTNSPHFADVVRYINNSSKFTGRIGLHLNIFRGKPCCNLNELEPLLSEGSFCESAQRIVYQTYISKTLREAIKNEFICQAETLIKYGIRPVFLNSEKHLHWLPWLWTDILEIAKQYNIPYIRACTCSIDSSKAFILNLLGKVNRNASTDGISDVLLTERLFGVGIFGDTFIKRFPVWINNSSNDIYEIICHPGLSYNSQEYLDKHKDFISFLDPYRHIECSFLEAAGKRFNLKTISTNGSRMGNMPAFIRES